MYKVKLNYDKEKKLYSLIYNKILIWTMKLYLRVVAALNVNAIHYVIVNVVVIK